MKINRKALRVALAQREITLKEISRRTDLDLLRIYRITARKVKPRPEELEILSRALGLNPSDLEVQDART